MKKAAKASSKQQQAPVISKAQAPAVFEKLVRNADDYDHAWSLVRKAFPRKPFGKVREIVQAFSKFKTLRAAFTALHGKGAKHGAKSELQRAA